MKHWFGPAFLREIRASWKKLTFSALTLGLGMAALTALLLTNTRMELQTQRQAATILGGDAEISDVRLLPESLLKKLQSSNQIQRTTRITAFVSMVTVAQLSRPRLVEVLSIEPTFPLTSGLTFLPALNYSTLRAGGILVEKSFADTHGLQVSSEKNQGDLSEKSLQKLFQSKRALRIGKKIFPIVGLVENDQMRDFASFNLGSRIYMAREIALGQKFISQQSRLRDRFLLRFSQPDGADKTLNWLREELKVLSPSQPALRHKDDALNSAFKPARSLMLFFNAIGLTALLLLGLGSAQSLHSYLVEKQADARVLSNLGAERRWLLLLYVGNVVLICSFSLVAGAALGEWIFKDVLTPRLGQWMFGGAEHLSLFSETSLAIKFTLSSFLLILSLIFPGILAFNKNKWLSAIAESSSKTVQKPRPQIQALKKLTHSMTHLLVNFPDAAWISVALLLSFFISNETTFNIFLVLVVTTVYIILRFVVVFVSRIGLSPNIRLPLSLRLAGSEIAARPTQSGLSLLLFGLSTCLLAFMWDLRTNISEQIRTATSGEYRPNVFVLDAPPDAMKSVQEILGRFHTKQSIMTEKITRARLTAINNASADLWVQQFDEQDETRKTAERLLAREQNLTSREQLADDDQVEQVTDGEFWKKETAKTPLNEVSVERGIAKRLNIKLGDSLTFDIQGVSITVKVTSLRFVRWQSFRPNFFFVLHPSVLIDAPFRGLFAAQVADKKQRSEILNELSQAHPGITALDATELAELANRLLTTALDIVRILTLLLFSGALINTVLSAWTSFTQRAQNFSLYRCLGANNALVMKSILSEFFLISLIGCLVGLSASWMLSIFVQQKILAADEYSQLSFLPGFIIVAVTVVVCLVTALVSSGLILRQAPFRVLRRAY
jgi:putative ABC transport system permease protein